MSLDRHRPQLSLELPLPRPNIFDRQFSNSFPNIPNLMSSTTNTTQKVDNLFDLEKLCVLGHGNYGVVYKVRHKHTSAIYALKIIRDTWTSTSNYQSTTHEMKILCCTDSPFIIKCHGIFEPLNGEKAILMEYMDAGTLATLLNKHGPLPESSLAHIAYQILSGLKYLHTCNIAHLDVKPANILVDKDMNVKIADFGVSKMMKISKTPSDCDPYLGTYAYMSPERLNSYTYDSSYIYAADVWSLGVTLLELYVGHFPFFPAGKRPSWMELVSLTCFEEPPRLPEEASEEFRSFVKCCLEKEPSKRWTVLQLLCHPFVCMVEN